MALQTADPRPHSRWGQFDLLTHRHRTVYQRARNHGSESAHRETPINRQARPSKVKAGFGVVEDYIEDRFQLVQSGAGVSRHRHHLTPGECRPFQNVLHLGLDQFHQFVINQVGFGNNHHTTPDA